MITLANIRRAIYCLNKRIDQLNNQIKDMLGLDSSSVQSLINILNDKDASTGILNTLLQKADKSEIPAAQIQSDWNQQDDTKLDYIKNKPTTTNGEDGKSAYELAVDNGFNGTEQEWLASLKGQDGTNGTNGVTPHIDSVSKHWMIGEVDTGIVAEGQDGTNGTNGTNGITPHIDQTTGNWFIGEINTGVRASFSNESAASGGSTLSLVTTGEKYNWNNKANIWRGTQAEYDLIQTPDNNTIYIIQEAS